jgi:hypothetical protein
MKDEPNLTQMVSAQCVLENDTKFDSYPRRKMIRELKKKIMWDLKDFFFLL